MKFELYKDVVLTCDLPAERLKRGDIVKLVEHHVARDGEDGYRAEVFNALGETLTVIGPLFPTCGDGCPVSAEAKCQFAGESQNLRLQQPFLCQIKNNEKKKWFMGRWIAAGFVHLQGAICLSQYALMSTVVSCNADCARPSVASWSKIQYPAGVRIPWAR